MVLGEKRACVLSGRTVKACFKPDFIVPLLLNEYFSDHTDHMAGKNEGTNRECSLGGVAVMAAVMAAVLAEGRTRPRAVSARWTLGYET